jgi:hypothetical protein
MNKRDIEAAVALGYSIVIGSSENDLLTEGKAFDSVEDFQEGLKAARADVGDECPYNKVSFCLKTADGLITYRGRFYLEAQGDVDVFQHVMDCADEDIELAGYAKTQEESLNIRIRALTNKVLFAVIASHECRVRQAALRAEIALYKGEATAQA